MRGRTVVPRSTLSPWLAGGAATPLSSAGRLTADLAAMGFTAIIGDYRLGVGLVGGELDTWADALGVGVTAAAPTEARRPTIAGDGAVSFNLSSGESLTSNLTPLLDWAGGASLLAGGSKSGAGSQKIMTLWDAANGFMLNDQTSGTNARYGQIATPTVVSTAFGSLNTLGVPIMAEVGYTPLAPLKVQQYDSDTRASAGNIAALPIGGSSVLELHHHNNAGFTSGVMYWWMVVMPQLSAPAAALVRAWSEEQHPAVLFV